LLIKLAFSGFGPHQFIFSGNLSAYPGMSPAGFGQSPGLDDIPIAWIG
jgi:hypothetical protein